MNQILSLFEILSGSFDRMSKQTQVRVDRLAKVGRVPTDVLHDSLAEAAFRQLLRSGSAKDLIDRKAIIAEFTATIERFVSRSSILDVPHTFEAEYYLQRLLSLEMAAARGIQMNPTGECVLTRLKRSFLSYMPEKR